MPPIIAAKIHTVSNRSRKESRGVLCAFAIFFWLILLTSPSGLPYLRRYGRREQSRPAVQSPQKPQFSWESVARASDFRVALAFDVIRSDDQDFRDREAGAPPTVKHSFHSLRVQEPAPIASFSRFLSARICSSFL